MRSLIIGQTSFIGQKLFNSLAKQDHQVYGTTRSTKLKTTNILEFDLAWKEQDWPAFPEQIDSVFFSSAMTSQKVVEENQQQARFINVEQTIKVINFFLERGSHIVFPSTNLVLPNDTPEQKIDTPYNPLSLYASFKAEIEKELLKAPTQATICRLPKILGPSTPIIQNWVRKLKDRETIQALTDLIVAPVSITYTINTLSRIMEQQPGGIIQLSGHEISYFNIARMIAEELDIQEHLVQPQTSQEISLSLASSPKHPGMDTTRTEQILGIPRQSLAELIADIIE